MVNEVEKDSLFEKLSEEHGDMLRSKLNEKEVVLDSLYELAEHMCLDGDCRSITWIEIVSDAIDYIKEHAE